MANRDRVNRYGAQLNQDGSVPSDVVEAFDDVSSALSMQKGIINAAPARSKPKHHSPGSSGSLRGSPGSGSGGSPSTHAMPQPHRQRPLRKREKGGGEGMHVAPGQFASSDSSDPIQAEIEAHMRARAAALGSGALDSDDENEDDGRGGGRLGGDGPGSYRAPGELKVPSPVPLGDEAANASISSTADFLARRRQRNRGQTGSMAEYGDPLPLTLNNQYHRYDEDDIDYGGGGSGKEDVDPQNLDRGASKRRGSGSSKTGETAASAYGNAYSSGNVHLPNIRKG